VTDHDAVISLVSDTCPSCGRRKAMREVLCDECFARLDGRTQDVVVLGYTNCPCYSLSVALGHLGVREPIIGKAA